MVLLGSSGVGKKTPAVSRGGASRQIRRTIFAESLGESQIQFKSVIGETDAAKSK